MGKRLKRKKYLELLEALDQELVAMARWAQASGARIMVLFEGRDTAGKGGVINAISRHLNPRQCHTVALARPSDREKGQWYFQRYVQHLPARGEIVLFDRSWYNRAGVEKVMGFCSRTEVSDFLAQVPVFEKLLVDDGILLFKYWLTCDQEEQEERLFERLEDPLKRWKLSPVDFEALARFDAYSDARTRMFEETHSEHAPWTVILNNDKQRGRLAVLRVVLRAIDYEGKDLEAIGHVDDKIAMDPERFLADKQDR